MTGKQMTTLVLSVTLLMPGIVMAGPKCEGDCPRSEYARLHYWAPTLFLVRAYVHPSNLDQYPPGPAGCIAPSYEFTKQKCPTTPAMPTSPYADPAGYYGRAATLP